jgi:hypothetical protein
VPNPWAQKALPVLSLWFTLAKQAHTAALAGDAPSMSVDDTATATIDVPTSAFLMRFICPFLVILRS